MDAPEGINNRIKIVEVFLCRGAEVNMDPRMDPPPEADNGEMFYTAAHHTPLLLALIASGKLACLLLAAGADVNVTSSASELYSPLQCAARYSPWLLSQLLVARGADVKAVGGRYGTALHAAAKWNTANSSNWMAGCRSFAAFGGAGAGRRRRQRLRRANTAVRCRWRPSRGT